MEIEMDTVPLYLTLRERNFYDCMGNDKRQEWEIWRSKDCNDSFYAEACNTFLPWTCSNKHEKDMNKENVGCSRKIFDALNCGVCVARLTAVTFLYSTSLISAAKDLKSEHLKSAKMVHWKNTETCWMRQKIQLLLIVGVAQRTIV